MNSQSDEMRPCPLCGSKEIRSAQTKRTCGYCGFNDPQNTWEDFYCWKELDSLKADNAKLLAEIEKLKNTITELQIQHSRGMYTPIHEVERRMLKVLCDELAEALERTKKLTMGPSLDLQDSIMVQVLEALKKHQELRGKDNQGSGEKK